MPGHHGVESLLDAVADASTDASRVLHVAARYCTSDLLAVSLDRRALDHEAHAQALQAARQGPRGLRRTGTLAGAVRCRWLQMQLVGGMRSGAPGALSCANAERRLVVAIDRALDAAPHAAVTRVMNRQRAQMLRRACAPSQGFGCFTLES